MDKSTHQMRREQWTQIINECINSGMSKRAWCKTNGISDKTFFYWQRILRTEAYIEQKQLPAAAEQKTETPVAFVELRPASSPKGMTADFQPDVVIRNGSFIFEISNTASAELISCLGGFLHAQ